MKKKVSIIIPVYKNVHFLKKSLKSAVFQTYKNIEILIINDGNSISDRNQIYKIRNKYKKKNIIIINIPKNKGVSNALNEGIKRSKGHYISWLSHDDFFHKDKTKLQVNFLRKNKAKICSCDFIEINNIKKYKIDRTLDKNYYDDQILSIILNDSLHGCSLIIEKTCFKEFLFKIKYKHIQDYDLWNRMSEKYYFTHLSKKLLFSNKHVSQSSYIKKDESTVEKIKFYKNLLQRNLLFYNFSQLTNVIKFMLRSIFMYKSFSLAFIVIKRFIFYNFYNYLRLYLNKN